MQNKDNSINKRIAQYRNLAGYTQESAADILGINKNTYARMERTGSPKPELLIKIAKIYNVPVEKILYGEKTFINTEQLSDTVQLHDTGISIKKNNKDIVLTTNEKNCIMMCRNLGNNERAELMKYINQYVKNNQQNNK